jgi:hypothetical protein
MSSTSKSTATMKVSGASSAASSTKQEASPLPVVGFGMADVAGEVEEQAGEVEEQAPPAAGTGQASSSVAPSTEASSEEVQLLYDVRRSSLPMRRCDRPDFKYLLLTTIGNDGSRPYKDNATALDNDYCCVCNCLASECKQWISAPDGQRCHCNAFTLKGEKKDNRTSVHWELRALAKQEPLYAYLEPPTVREFTVYYKLVKARMDRAWRLYQAGEEVEGEFVHNFKHVAQCFQKHCGATRIEKREEHWKRKASMLMAITTTMVKQSFKKPEHAEGTWGEEANGEQYKKMMLSLGSRWLTILATCPASDRHLFMPRLREYLRKLYVKAKHADEFKAGFGVLYELLHVGVGGKERSVTRSACNLLYSIHCRKKDDSNLQREKYFVVKLKDSFMIPFLRWVITDYPCSDQGLMKTARMLLATNSLNQEPSVEAVCAFTNEGGDLHEALLFMERRLSHENFSGKGSQRRRELEDMAKVLKHIAGEGSEPPTGEDLCCASLLAYAKEVKEKLPSAPSAPSAPPPAPSTNMYDGVKSRKRKRTQ